MSRFDKIKRLLFLLTTLFFIFGCKVDNKVKGNIAGQTDPLLLNLESRNDGNGHKYTQEINLNKSEVIDLYPVWRNPNGQFIENPEVEWTLIGEVGQLIISSGGNSATLKATSPGQATIKVKSQGSSSTTQVIVSSTPFISMVNPIENLVVNSNDVSNVLFNGTCSEVGQNVNISLNTSELNTTAVCASDMTWSKSIDISSVSEGAVAISLTHSNGGSESASPIASNLSKDTSGPTSTSFNINSSASYTSLSTVTLNFAASDVAKYYLTPTSGCSSGGSWLNFVSSSTTSVLSTNSSNTWYVKFSDSAGNESSCINASITHDDQSPGTVGSITHLGSFNSLTSSPTISWSAASDTSGISHYEVAIGTGTSGAAQTDMTSGWVNVGNVTSATINSGNGLSTLTDSSTYYASVRAVDLAGNPAGPISVSSGWVAQSCPANFIKVPAFTGTTTYEFCVAKYEMRNDGSNNAISAPTGTVYTGLTRSAARAKCQAMGQGYELINNKQWMALARNIENVGWNWSSGVPFAASTTISEGHTDASTTVIQTADATDTDMCLGTGQTCDASTWDSQRRVFKLSTGEYIWDLAGNIHEWVRDSISHIEQSHATYYTVLHRSADELEFLGSSAGLQTAHFNLGRPYLYRNPREEMTRGGSYTKTSNAHWGLLGYDNNIASGAVPTVAPGFRCVHVIGANLDFGSEDLIDMGSANQGSTKDLTITIKNVGNKNATALAPAAFSDSSFNWKDGTFPGTGGNCSLSGLNAGSSCDVVITFSPTAPTSNKVDVYLDISITDSIGSHNESVKIRARKGCPSGFIPVLANAAVGQSNDFCVAKYEMSLDSNSMIQSTHSVSMLASVYQYEAKFMCDYMGGPGFHLINNAERMTIARDLESVSANWSSGTVGTGALSQGHSDGTPNNQLQASSNDNDSCYGTGQTCDLSTWSSQRRAMSLSNGEYIWDFAGNLEEWLDYTLFSGRADQGVNAWIEIFSSTPTGTMPSTAYQPFTPGLTHSSNMIGQYQPGNNLGSPYGTGRYGGYWPASSNSGIFKLDMSGTSTSVSGVGIGFRCAYSP